MKRRFVINKYKGYSIRNHYFVSQPSGGCVLETDDEEVIRLVEGADGYGVFIHPAETPDEIAAMKKADERKERTVPRYNLDEPEYPFRDDVVAPEPEEKKNEKTGMAEGEEEEAPPIAHQGARGTHAGRGQRKGQFIDPKEK